MSRVAPLALVILVGGCGFFSRIPEYVLVARTPNTTAPKFIVPPDGKGAPTAPDLLLFVHGIFGDTVATWSRVGKPGLPELVLARPEFKGRFDAFAYGFPSSMVKSGSFSVTEAAQGLHREFTTDPVLASYRRIVMVAHSMGGLVALQSLLTYADLRSRVPLVVTFGTPYNGSQAATLAKDVIANQALVDMLARDGGNSFLSTLSTQWKQAKDDGVVTTKVVCSYEKMPMPTFGLIVPESSGSALCDNAADPIAADHIMMVKPDGATHDSVKVLTSALKRLSPPRAATWSPLAPRPGELPGQFAASQVAPVLLGQEHPLGPSAQQDLERRRRQTRYFPPAVQWFVFTSPSYPGAAARRFELTPGVDATMSVIALDDSGPTATVLDRPRTMGREYQWPGRADVSSVRFAVFVFPLTAEAQRFLEQRRDLRTLFGGE